MSFSERQEAFRKQVWAEAEKTMGKEYIEFARKSSRKAVRDKIIAMNHYYHILLLMGEPTLDKVQMYVYSELASEKIAKLKDQELRHKELIKINLLSTHTSAWNIAHFHYEKAIKILCMMMVTLMDYIIQEQGGKSILYKNREAKKYFNLLDEITSLNADYQDEYFSICAFDFCTKKLGNYLHVPEYDSIAMEQERVINNGNPQRVNTIMQISKKPIHRSLFIQRIFLKYVIKTHSSNMKQKITPWMILTVWLPQCMVFIKRRYNSKHTGH